MSKPTDSPQLPDIYAQAWAADIMEFIEKGYIVGMKAETIQYIGLMLQKAYTKGVSDGVENFAERLQKGPIA